MNKTLIIAFGHKMRMGKDSVVAHLIETYKGRFDIRRYAFADELKLEYTSALKKHIDDGLSIGQAFNVLESWAGVPHDDNMAMNDPLCPYGKSRTLTQFWGGDYRRKGLVAGKQVNTPDEFYWVRKLRDRIRSEQPQIALISDLRYKNEAAMVKSESQDNRTVRIDRQGFDLGLGSDHVSETELDDYGYDYEAIVQDGDLDELKRDGVYIMELILEQLSAKYAVVPENIFDKLKANKLPDGEVAFLPSATKAAAYKISTPDGTHDAAPEEVTAFLSR
jgi:hypothetical protein